MNEDNRPITVPIYPHVREDFRVYWKWKRGLITDGEFRQFADNKGWQDKSFHLIEHAILKEVARAIT